MKHPLASSLFLGLAGLLAVLLTGCGNSYAPLATVPSVDLSRYQGLWYEIARLPQRFEKDCYCVTAEYTINPDGYVDVTNTCRKGGASGEVKRANGKAFPVEGTNNSKLRVQFFWPFRGDYWVLELDSNYSHALVGSPDRESLWILARTPVLDSAVYRDLVENARAQGFPTQNLERTVQLGCSR